MADEAAEPMEGLPGEEQGRLQVPCDWPITHEYTLAQGREAIPEARVRPGRWRHCLFVFSLRSWRVKMFAAYIIVNKYHQWKLICQYLPTKGYYDDEFIP